MFANQMEAIAAFARQHPFPALAYLVLVNIALLVSRAPLAFQLSGTSGKSGPMQLSSIDNGRRSSAQYTKSNWETSR